MRKYLAVLAVVAVLGLVLSTGAFAQGMANVRVVHASPDAPAVDVLVDGAVAFENAPFKGITDYAGLDPATYNVQVVPTGETEPVVIDADLSLDADTDYTVVAVDVLENIEPLVLVDDNTLPGAGSAKVRFVHASPNAPNVDIQVADGGPMLFENIPFKQASDYLTVDAGTYDLEVLIHDSGDVALEVPGVALNENTVYTIFAMGLAGGDPALQAVPSVDATGEVLPESGGMSNTLTAILALLGIGLIVTIGGFALRRRSVRVTH